MITPLVRFSYANVFEARKTPSGDMKFSCALLLPKEDTEGYKHIANAIQIAINNGLEKNVFAKAHLSTLRPTVRDGDKELDSEGNPKNPGYWFFNSNSSNAPGVVDSNLNPIMSQDEFYSGCWGHADINFAAYNQAGNRGVGCYLNNLMKKKDDERLDGRQSAETAFGKYADAPDTSEGFSPEDKLPLSTNPFT